MPPQGLLPADARCAMHELSLMAAVLDIALEQAALQGGGRIRRISLRIGSLAGVDPDCLQLAAEVVLQESVAAGAQLEIIPVPALCRCGECSLTYEAIDGLCVCPGCGGLGGQLLQGRELELHGLELDQLSNVGSSMEPAREPWGTRFGRSASPS